MLKVYPIDIPQKDLAEQVTRFRETLAAKRGGFPRLARELHDRLLKPAQAQLQGKRNLIIVPDGVLWELPFQALQVKENRYLLEDAAVSYAPSLTVLREMQKVRLGVWESGSMGDKNTPTPTFLAFGNPTLGKEMVERVHLVHRDGNLNPLPEAEREVKALGELYGATRSKVYVGTEAREERVKAEALNYQILHFATHGLLNDRSPMYSQILLSQSMSQRVNESMNQRNSHALTHLPVDPLTQTEDGLLEAWELMNLDLQADLVVLSACETARGRVSAGEGVIGLTWALFVAGCPTTVVSQWKVADASTSRLMVEFHRQLKTQSKAEALRQAQLKLMKDGKHQHPFYWAAFVLVGDGR